MQGYTGTNGDPPQSLAPNDPPLAWGVSVDDIGKANLGLLLDLKAEVLGYLSRELNRADIAAASSTGIVLVESEARVHELRTVIGVIQLLFYRKEAGLRGTSGDTKEGEAGKTVP